MMAPSWMPGVLLLVTLLEGVANATRGPFVPPPKELLDAEKIVMQPEVMVASASVGGAPLSQAGWTATADSAQNGYPASNAIDGNPNTFWHTEWLPNTAQLPHTITIDMKAVYVVN